ncbi:Fc.00g025160.m01.CDS01 [Cosmosporella sp. VM-42]
MAIVDQDEDTAARGGRLMHTFLELKQQLQRVIGGELIISETEAANPSSTWEEWIFAESRRRIGCLWFAINRVFALKTSRAGCSTFNDFLSLPLTSAKTAWEARSLEEWEAETSLCGISYPIATFGELVSARKQPGDTVNARKLDTWEAGADKLGMMMNIAVELVGEF